MFILELHGPYGTLEVYIHLHNTGAYVKIVIFCHFRHLLKLCELCFLPLAVVFMSFRTIYSACDCTMMWRYCLHTVVYCLFRHIIRCIQLS